MKKFDSQNNFYNSIHNSHYLQIMGSLPLTQVCSLRTTTRKIVLLNSQNPCDFLTYNFAICFLWNENQSILLFTMNSMAPVLLHTVALLSFSQPISLQIILRKYIYIHKRTDLQPQNHVIQKQKRKYPSPQAET